MLVERDGQRDVVKILDFGIAKVTAAAVGRRGAHAGGRHLRHARVPVARAGAGRGGRRARRHLRGRRHPLRDARRPAAVRERGQGQDHLDAPRARAAAHPRRQPDRRRAAAARAGDAAGAGEVARAPVRHARPRSCRRSTMPRRATEVERRRRSRAHACRARARADRGRAAPRVRARRAPVAAALVRRRWSWAASSPSSATAGTRRALVAAPPEPAPAPPDLADRYKKVEAWLEDGNTAPRAARSSRRCRSGPKDGARALHAGPRGLRRRQAPGGAGALPRSDRARRGVPRRSGAARPRRRACWPSRGRPTRRSTW